MTLHFLFKNNLIYNEKMYVNAYLISTLNSKKIKINLFSSQKPEELLVYSEENALPTYINVGVLVFPL